MAIHNKVLLSWCVVGFLLPTAPAWSQQPYYDDSAYQDSQQHRQQQFGREDRVGLGVLLIEGDRGVEIREIIPQSPAEEAGLRPGDEIVGVNGNRIQRIREMVQRLREYEPGKVATIRVFRDGEMRTLRVRLRPRVEALRQFRQQYQDQAPYDQGQPYDQYGRLQQRFRPDMQERPWRPEEFRQRPQELVRTLVQLERQVEQLRQTIRQLRSELQQRREQDAYRYEQERQRSYQQDMYDDMQQRQPRERDQYDY